MLNRWVTRLRGLLRGRRIEADFDEELRYHLEQQIEQNLRCGMDSREAREAAVRQLGNPLLLREEARETWRWRRLDEIVRDLRYAVRGLGNNPGFSAVAILSLGFGIGAATTLFSVIDAADYRPLPFHEPDRLVWLAQLTPEDDPDCARCPATTSVPVANEWRRQTSAFEAFAVLDSTYGCLETGGRIECPDLGWASAGFFTLLGVQPILGRDFLPRDTAPAAEPVVILSHETWLRRYDGDPAVIGSRFEYASSASFEDHRSSTIVGVLPRGFRFNRDYPGWMPFPDDQVRPVFRSIGTITVVARLKPGIDATAAESELRAVHAGLATEFEEAARTIGAIRPLREKTGSGAGEGRGTLFSITLIVLGIAVLNVAGLLTARAAARHREFSVRRALGASRGRLVRQLLVEGSALGIAGGLLGSFICVWGVGVANLHFRMQQYGSPAQIDHRVLAFAISVALLAGILATLLPVVGIGRGGALGGLRRAATPAQIARQPAPGRPGNGTPGVLLVCQIAAALVLLSAAGLLGSDYLELRYLDIGYDPASLYEISIRGPDQYEAQPELMRPDAESIRARIEQAPGVVAASLSHYAAPWPEVVRLEGIETVAEGKSIWVEAVEADYFDTMGIPIIEGRPFAQQDLRDGEPVAIINRTAARAYGRSRSGLGRRVFIGNSETDGEWLTVVGVVEDVERGGMRQRHYPRVYRPLARAPIYGLYFRLDFKVAEGRTDVVRSVETSLSQALGRPIRPAVSHEEQLGARFLTERINAMALNAFAAFALLLAAIGVYGSIAYAVARRTREIGIRVALGAERSSILALFARRAVVITALGAALGLGGAFVLTRVLQSFVSATSVTDPRVFGGAALMLLGAILLAIYLPARRAIAVDPTTALSSE